MDSKLRDYALITGNYWAFTLTDGALRMLVVLHFHILGFAPFEIASLFLFYEFFGIPIPCFPFWAPPTARDPRRLAWLCLGGRAATGHDGARM